MSQQQESQFDRSVIPEVQCPHCKTNMRLAIIEPATMAAFGRDTLVFECTCGIAIKRPVAER